MPRSTYYDQLRKLESLGFLEIPEKGNMIHFYEVQHSGTHTQSACDAHKNSCEKSTPAVNSIPAQIQNRPQENIEIYINNKERITNIPEE